MKTYHDKSARGLLLSANPIVLGFVACSSAYAVSVAFQDSRRLTPSCSIRDNFVSSVAEAGRFMAQKLTTLTRLGWVL